MPFNADALIVGAGPAGSATAILLAQAGWSVVLVEQSVFPRQKVCGECISAGCFTLLDALGIGADFHGAAGPELRHVGWVGRRGMIIADFPPCQVGPYRYGRAIGRDRLDQLLLERARRSGVTVLQPAKVRSCDGVPGDFTCTIQSRTAAYASCHARVIIDAHGSWEAGPSFTVGGATPMADREPHLDADLFAFKASFQDSALAPGLLPVIVFAGGYGGMVVADGGRTTLACCIRRDALHASRSTRPGASAGAAVVEYLRQSCHALRGILEPARVDTAWLGVGPIRPGIRVDRAPAIFKVGNAAGETHPLIGEGITMALQSADLLARHLIRENPATMDLAITHETNRRYSAAWRNVFASRLRFAAGYAHAAMRPTLTTPVNGLLRCWPSLLTRAARWAGKARGARA